jgi:hypothetical protein
MADQIYLIQRRRQRIRLIGGEGDLARLCSAVKILSRRILVRVRSQHFLAYTRAMVCQKYI